MKSSFLLSVIAVFIASAVSTHIALKEEKVPDSGSRVQMVSPEATGSDYNLLLSGIEMNSPLIKFKENKPDGNESPDKASNGDSN